jgi:hypothetical protein
MSDEEINTAIERLAHTHQLAIEALTEIQIADAIRQAILSGDFQRNISANSQSVTYTPYRKLKDAERERDEWCEMAAELADAAACGLAQWDDGYSPEVSSKIGKAIMRFQKMTKEAAK